jgi:hypothetical protein
VVLEVCAPGAIGWQGRSKVLVWALGDDSGSALGSLRSLLPPLPIHALSDQLTFPIDLPSVNVFDVSPYHP